jgi:hypothetical protein
VSVAFALSVTAAWLIGLLALLCTGWGTSATRRDRSLLIFLAIGVGLGLTSSLFIVWLLSGAPAGGFPYAELVMLVLLAGGAFYGRSRNRWSLQDPDGSADAGRPVLGLVLLLTVGCAVTAFVVEWMNNRQGTWDAWMTWNMHARALFRGGEQWREALTGLPAWSHPDYPLLVPGSVARIWTYVGQETTVAPGAVAMLFTFATIGLLYSAVASLRSRTQGVLAALVLVSTKFYILQGASQYADIPLSFFFLATLALLSLGELSQSNRSRLLMMAGATAGLSAWTKNEGTLFVLAVLIVYGGVMGRALGWRQVLATLRSFAIGLGPAVLLLAFFKVNLAPANDLMSDHGLRQIAERLLDGGRYVRILTGVTQAVLEVGAKGLIPVLLLGYLLAAGTTPGEPARREGRAAAIVVSLMLAGYAVVLLTAPAPLLDTNIRSINRLLLQLWPSMLFAYFMSVRTIDEAGIVRPRLSPA